MASNKEQLQELVELAGETSSEKRRELLESISEMFFEEPASFNQAETDLIGDIIGRVADDVEEQVRVHLSERLSDVDNAPRALAR